MADQRVTVYCGRCGTPLTEPVRVVDEVMLRRSGTGPSLAAGQLVVDSQPVTVRIGERDGRRVVERVVTIVDAGSLVVNPDDLLVAALTEIGTTRGCCGLNGGDGDNQACAGCGQTVGRVWTECWTQHEMRFCRSAVKAAVAGGYRGSDGPTL